MWGAQPLLITTATNGLHCEKDKLLAVALVNPETGIRDLFFHDTHGQELIEAQKYHCITEEVMNTWGRSTEAFTLLVEEALKDKVLLTYNPQFQYGFLSNLLQDPSLVLYDLSVIEQALRKGLKFDEEEIATPGKFYSACSTVYYPLAVNTICKNLKMTKQPSPGQLPLERSLEILQRLYNEASSKELQLLQS